jgi:hypothetical protein
MRRSATSYLSPIQLGIRALDLASNACLAAATASGDWRHVRSRTGSLVRAEEPLLNRVPDWSHGGTGSTGSTDGAAVYGLRRSGK